MNEKTPHEKQKDVARLVLAALGATPTEPTPEQVSLTGRTMMREGIMRRILPPMPVTEDPFLKACQEITGLDLDRPIKVRSAFPPSIPKPLMEVDYKSIEADFQDWAVDGRIVPPMLGLFAGRSFDKICTICRRSLHGTGFRNTDAGPVHVACFAPKPAEPYVPPEIEG